LPHSRCTEARSQSVWNASVSNAHALTIDNGWREVADTALAFIKRFA
jgi:hypothetical protein